MNAAMNDYEALSYCGIYCGDCSNYRQNMNCGGCKSEPELLWDCTTRACAANKGLLHCGQCPEFPCAELKEFYHDGKPSHLKAYENMLEIIGKGADVWLDEQNPSTQAPSKP
ncbi:MAG: DUF3795 domain-containing protein [Eggerthellaceae bacterium]|jgi:hypothetical protein|nr:DUF3795 domain-containing protein [Eggerthellaceae bacterium]MDR2721414.1 DUF3795 domain-containing protein [Coriobacteriaceae bacterium]